MSIIKGNHNLHNEGGGKGLRFATSVLQKMVNIAYDDDDDGDGDDDDDDDDDIDDHNDDDDNNCKQVCGEAGAEQWLVGTTARSWLDKNQICKKKCNYQLFTRAW